MDWQTSHPGCRPYSSEQLTVEPTAMVVGSLLEDTGFELASPSFCIATRNYLGKHEPVVAVIIPCIHGIGALPVRI